MANTSILQVRTDPADREHAAAILESLGTNLSAVVNMLLKQIILTKSLPFEVKLEHPENSAGYIVDQVRATFAMEGMDLTEKDVHMLTDYVTGRVTGDELREQIILSAHHADRSNMAEDAVQ